MAHWLTLGAKKPGDGNLFSQTSKLEGDAATSSRVEARPALLPRHRDT